MSKIENLIYRKICPDFYEVGMYDDFDILFEGNCCKKILDELIKRAKQDKAKIEYGKPNTDHNNLKEEMKENNRQVQKKAAKIRRAIHILKSII